MSAAAVLRDAVLAQLNARLAGRVNRVLGGEPVSATVPYLELRDMIARDWGTKDRAGRELRLGITVRDAGDGPGRIQQLAGEAEAAIEALPRDLPGWRIASIMLVRSAVLSEGAGRWAALVDHRIRMLAA